MAEALYLVVKATPEAPVNTIIDGIHAVLINKDDGQTDAQIIADAEAQCRAGGHPVKSGYFTNVYGATALIGAAGALTDNKDTMIFLPRGTQTVQG